VCGELGLSAMPHKACLEPARSPQTARGPRGSMQGVRTIEVRVERSSDMKDDSGPLYESWSKPAVACPCGERVDNLLRVFREPPPAAPPDTRLPVMEQYHHSSSRVCEVTSKDGNITLKALRP